MAEFDEILITTGVDALVRLVKEKGRIELELASKLLMIPSTTIQDWAKILEEEGVLKVEYYLTKVYLSWAEKSDVEIQARTETLKEEKKEVISQAEALKKEVTPQIEELDGLKESFEQVYKKLQPRLEMIEKKLGESKSQVDTSKLDTKIQETEDKISTLLEELTELKTELEESKENVKKIDGIGQKIEQFSELKTRVTDLLESIDTVKTHASSAPSPTELPDVSDLKKKFEQIKGEYATLKKQNGQLRLELTNIAEGKEILSHVASAIGNYSEDAQKLHADLKAMKTVADELAAQSAEISNKIKNDLDAVDHFSDSITVAKGILQRFPSQEQLMGKLDEILKKEQILDGKLEAFAKIANSLDETQSVSEDFEDLKNQIETTKEMLESESNDIFNSITEAGDAYATYQQIRDRTVKSIENYGSKIVEIEADVKKAKKELDAELEQAKKAIDSASREATKIEGIGNIDDLLEKKKALEEIHSAIDSLTLTADGLRRQIEVLGKEVQLVSIQSSGASGKPRTEQESKVIETKISNQITLTKDEEAEFKKKRDELKNLIKKLWEDN